RKAIKRRCRRIAEARRDLKESLAESLHDLEGGSIDAALASARERIAEVNTTAALRLREVELRERLETLSQHRDRIIPQLRLPGWVYFVREISPFVGVIRAGGGVVAGGGLGGIAGAIYARRGVPGGGRAGGLKIQYEGAPLAGLRQIESAATPAAD